MTQKLRFATVMKIKAHTLPQWKKFVELKKSPESFEKEKLSKTSFKMFQIFFTQTSKKD